MYINVDTQPCIAWNTSAIALPFYMTYFVGDVSYDIGPRQKVTVLQKYLGQFFFFLPIWHNIWILHEILHK